MSSRKYDWNVAPKDLEKIRRAHGACVVFFLKKIKRLFTSTTTVKECKKVFFNLSYYYYNTIKQSTLLFSSIMFYLLKRCQEKFFKNILSLLAGKSEQIFTAFPLTTFLWQKLTEFTLNFSTVKIFSKFL